MTDAKTRIFFPLLAFDLRQTQIF